MNAIKFLFHNLSLLFFWITPFLLSCTWKQHNQAYKQKYIVTDTFENGCLKIEQKFDKEGNITGEMYTYNENCTISSIAISLDKPHHSIIKRKRKYNCILQFFSDDGRIIYMQKVIKDSVVEEKIFNQPLYDSIFLNGDSLMRLYWLERYKKN